MVLIQYDKHVGFPRGVKPMTQYILTKAVSCMGFAICARQLALYSV